MTPQTSDQIQKVMSSGDKSFRNAKLPAGDFTKLSLKNFDFRGASLQRAKFREADLTYCNFEGANLYGADFTDAICHRTNFKDANLSHTIFKPKVAFGMTVTLECKSFEGMETTSGWWAGWLIYGLLMRPPSNEARDRLIQAMGVEHWEVLKTQYLRQRW